MNKRTAALIGGLLTLSATSAYAQQTPVAQDFQLQTLDYGSPVTSVYGVGTTAIPAHLEPMADVAVEYADDPAVVRVFVDGEEQERLEVVGERWYMDLGLALGLFERVQVDARLGAILSQSGVTVPDAFEGVTGENLAAFSVGDLRLGAAYTFLNRETSPVGLAARGTLWLPTGSRAGFASDGVVRFEPRLVADASLGDVVLAANFGYLIRGERIAQNYRSDDMLRWGVAARWPILANVGLDGSVFGAHSPFPGRQSDDPTQSAPNDKAHPIEVVAGPWWDSSRLRFSIGAGTSLSDGVGAPRFRFVASVAYRAPAGAKAGPAGSGALAGQSGSAGDPDGDGIIGADDMCPYEPEDLDQFEDEDGCEDVDDDADGIADVVDACPNEPGIESKAGCPLVDADGDGVDDADDACPEQPEDLDGFEDADGCPDLDDDGDGIADVDDACPREAEVVNGNEDEDGCPDEGESLVSLQGDRIQILERVYFDTNRATIKQRSFRVLEQVAATLKNRPEIAKLQVAGHTDDRGNAGYNLDLSTRRARAVQEFLESRGIDSDRLSHIGYGESHPIDDNETEDGRATNRRVEFLIIRQKKAGGTP